jgi:hypothetical protein
VYIPAYVNLERKKNAKRAKKVGNRKTIAPTQVTGKADTQSIDVKRIKSMKNPLPGAPPPHAIGTPQ